MMASHAILMPFRVGAIISGSGMRLSNSHRFAELGLCERTAEVLLLTAQACLFGLAHTCFLVNVEYSVQDFIAGKSGLLELNPK